MMDVQISTGTRSDPDPNHGHQDRAQPGPFKCNVCQRTYARIDHLSRHFRLHTSERPYRCEVCYKAFNRPDLLKRHALIHPENGRYDKSHASRPRRVSQACKACAAAKLRCKEKKPCQRCEKKSITCEYNDIDNRIAGHWRATPQLISGSSTVPQNITSTTSESDPTGYPRDEDVHVHDENNTEFLSSSGRIRDDLGVKASRDVINVAQARIEDDPSLLLPMDGSAGELIGGDENMFADFLREVMMPTPLEQFNSQPLPAYDTDAQNTAFIDIFSFGLESDLELNDEDYNVMSFYHGRDPADNAGPKDVADNPYSSNEQLGLQSNTITQNNSECIALGANAFRSSPWCWTPVHADTGLIEEHYLTLQPSEMVTTGTQFAHAAHVNTDNLDSVARDKVMAMVLNTTSRSSFEKVMSSFPPVDLLNNCVHSFLASHRAQPDTWIHMPTLRIGKQRAALLGSFISAGAILSTSPTIRKLGFAINEAVRLALPRVCEENNSVTRDLGLLQAMMLNLDVGLWSGNKRKMELAESHSGVLTTMCRRASRFLRSNYKVIIPHESDQDEILEEKWKSWAYQESMKRLIFALFTRDAQTSISFIVPTIISYAELSLPLPESRSLFLARTANEWKSMYFSQTSSGNRNERIPSLQQCLLDIGPLTNPSIRSRIDITLSLSIIAYGIWGLIQDYRQLNSVAKSYPPSRLTPGMLVLEHRHQELCQMLQLFSVSLSEAEPRRKEVSGTILQSKLLTELLLTHLHVSFDNLQLFAGREGEEEARRVYPALQQWAASHEARTALYHAGQVVRHAKLLNGNGGAQQGGLRDFFAVAVYHSALTFWAFGVLGLGPRLGQDLHRLDTPNQNGSGEYDDNHEDDIVWLDAEESPATRSFIALGRGIPCFSTVAAGSEITAKEITRISDPQNVMNAIVKILRRVPSDEDSDTPLPPPLLVENLSQLIKGLGDATKGL